MSDPPSPAPTDPHYAVCDNCGQLFDVHNQLHVLHHMQAEHAPLTVPDEE
jgi:hypothetical protein